MQKSIISIFSLIFILALTFSPCSAMAYAATETEYLIHPTALTVMDQNLYVYDDHAGVLFKYSALPSTNGQNFAAKTQISGVKKLTNNGSSLYALTDNNGTRDLVYISADLTSTASLGKDNVIDFAVTAEKLYILKNDGNIGCFTFISDSSLSTPDPLDRDYFTGLPNGLGEFTCIAVVDSGLLHISSATATFCLDPTSHTASRYTTLPSAKQVKALSQNLVLTTDNTVLDMSAAGAEFKLTNGVSVSNFTFAQDIIYFTTPTVHKVNVYNRSANTITDLKINPETPVQWFTPQNFLHKKLMDVTNLYYAPYSVNSTITLPAGTCINIVGEYSDFYYCLVTSNGTNQILYLPKSTPSETVEIGVGGSRYTATRGLSVYSLPSTIVDGKNFVLKELSAGEEITVNSSSTLQNTSGELFYLTKINDTYGFVRSNFLQSTRSTVELTNHNNAKAKRDTILFENADGTGEIIELKKGTRISLLDDPAPNKTYLKAEYQDSKGVVYTGFVFSEDIKKDGLSTLQILGLILIVANLTVLTLIIIIKKRSQKWKHPEHSGNTNRPHHQDLT